MKAQKPRGRERIVSALTVFLLVSVLILLPPSLAQAAVDWYIYSDAAIEEGDEYANVYIYDTPPDRTTVSMFGGSASFIQSYDSSILNMFGGTTEACAYNQSTINVNGGTIYTLNSYDSSTVNTFGGSIYGLSAYDTGMVDVRDNAHVDILRARGYSVVGVSGGTLDIISASVFGTVNLSGGLVTDYLAAADSGIINVYGYNLAKTNTGGHYGYGFVSGEWIDHTAFSIDLGGSDTYQHIDLITVIDVEIEIRPETFNLTSTGKWITCHIWLPEDYNVTDVNTATVYLEHQVQPEWIWFNQKQNMMVTKFNRSEIQNILEPGEVELTVSGYLLDGTYFLGTDTIKVINKGHKNK